MPIWNLSAEISELRQAQIEEWRGKVDVPDFLGYALEIGLTHIEEEHVINQRARAYDDLRHSTDHFRASVERQKIKMVQSKTQANVTAFGNDVTRRPAR